MLPDLSRFGVRVGQVRRAGSLVTGLAALLYLIAGWLGHALAISPGYATPLNPAAGTALACVLVFGRPALVGVGIGSLLLNFGLALQHGWPGYPALWALGLACAAALQAWLATRLVERCVSQPLVLTEPRDILGFVAFAAPSACTVSASLALAVLLGTGTIPPTQGLVTWLTWWSGDTLGTLLAAPMLLTLIGQPRSEWASRRAAVGLTLATTMALLAIGIVQVTRLDQARAQADFEREAVSAAAALSFKLQEPLLALQAMRSVFVASDDLTSAQVRRATEAWLEPPTHIQAMGWSERVPREAVPAFVARVQGQGLPDYTVKDRGDGSGAGAAKGSDVVAIRYIEPLAGNVGALGVNALSIPQARDAIERSARDDQVAATAGFRLSQDAATSRQTGVVLYRAIFNGRPATAESRRAALRGVVFVTLRMDDLLSAALAKVPAGLSVCIIDSIGGASPQRLAGPEGCEVRPATRQHDQALRFADRDWTLRLGGPDAGAEAGSGAWILSAVGVGATALLSALLLGMTGRTRRIEAAVAERTAALSEEMREREQAEAAMRESEQRFRNIFNNVPIAVVYSDLQGRLQHVNPQFGSLTGYNADELLRMDVYDYLHPDDASQERGLTAQLVKGEIGMYRGHRRVLRKDGAVVWVQATMTLLRDSDGQPRRLVGVMEDITEHLRLVEAERAREQAEAANLAKSEFLSRMSHELRTPLNAMLGFAQLLELNQRHPLTPGQRPWVTQIQQAGWHLLEMINDVLDLSRIESGNVRLQLENLDLEALVDASLSLVARDAAKRGLRITRDFPAGAVAAIGDITRVKQILINLLSNAVKYNIDRGQIEIATRRVGEQVALVVSDTGLGMTPEQMAELFQPFNRLGRERSGLEGTGIGLVISRRLAELMGGSLHAESGAGSGSSFILTLTTAPDEDTVRSDLALSADLVGEYHRRIVHYVEDNETNIEVMRGILAQRPQVKMAVSMTGLDALSALRQEPPDMILLDMNLPDIDGLELLRHLKADPATSGIAVVVVSADALPAQIDVALDAGALRYLTKPVSVSELLRVLDEILHTTDSRLDQGFPP